MDKKVKRVVGPTDENVKINLKLTIIIACVNIFLYMIKKSSKMAKIRNTAIKLNLEDSFYSDGRIMIDCIKQH